MVKQRKRIVAQRTPEAIRKAIDMSLISDIIETIATAGTKDEVCIFRMSIRNTIRFALGQVILDL